MTTTLTPNDFSRQNYAGRTLRYASVYANKIRFNKAAAKFMELPKNVVFHFTDDGTVAMETRKDGFLVTCTKSTGEYCIHHRHLCTRILKMFDNPDKISFEILLKGDGLFELKKIGS